MSTKSNIAVIAAFLAVLAAPAHANNGDIGLTDRGQEVSGRPSATDAVASGSIDARRQTRPRNSNSSSPILDLIGHN